MKIPHHLSLILLILAAAFSACSPATSSPPARPLDQAPTAAPSRPAAATANAVPTASATAQPPTAQPIYLTATVWSSDPVAPVLAYHQFQEHGISGATNVRIDDFNRELQDLYQAGYVMVPLQSWLQGNLQVPSGKRPIVFTMDDLFYHNQIRFASDGSIDPTTGLGASYAFSQAHPDFGFHWALFMNLGDHPYATPANPQPLEQAVVWTLAHGAPLYNHTFTHAVLSKTSPDGVTWELSANDRALGGLLTQAGREDLLSGLGNIFSLPFGRWPRDPQSMSALENYKNTAGVPIQAILDIDFIVRPKTMAAPYSPGFNRWDVMRMVATVSAVDYFVQHAADIPAAQSCKLGPLNPSGPVVSSYLASQIRQAIQSGMCPPGVYATDHFVFRANSSGVDLIYTVQPGP
ncbi:MAG TPA: hypothetical protein VF784_06265 [Anaerolineales bacterium]